MRRLKATVLACLIILASGASAWPYRMTSADQLSKPTTYLKIEQYGGVSFRYGSSLTGKVTGRYLPRAGGIDLLPHRIAFIFEHYIQNLGPSSLEVMRTSGMTKTDQRTVRQLRSLLHRRPSLKGRAVPFILGQEGTNDFYARQTYLRFSNGTGIGFLTQLGLGAFTAVKSPFVYEFEGLTNDGRYAIIATMYVSAPNAPQYRPTRPINKQLFRASMLRITQFLNNGRDTATVPYISNLAKLIESLVVHPRAL